MLQLALATLRLRVPALLLRRCLLLAWEALELALLPLLHAALMTTPRVRDGGMLHEAAVGVGAKTTAGGTNAVAVDGTAAAAAVAVAALPGPVNATRTVTGSSSAELKSRRIGMVEVTRRTGTESGGLAAAAVTAAAAAAAVVVAKARMFHGAIGRGTAAEEEAAGAAAAIGIGLVTGIGIAIVISIVIVIVIVILNVIVIGTMTASGGSVSTAAIAAVTVIVIAAGAANGTHAATGKARVHDHDLDRGLSRHQHPLLVTAAGLLAKQLQPLQRQMQLLLQCPHQLAMVQQAQLQLRQRCGRAMDSRTRCAVPRLQRRHRHRHRHRLGRWGRLKRWWHSAWQP